MVVDLLFQPANSTDLDLDPRRDVLEGTYAGGEVNGVWRPSPYSPADARRPLIDAAEATKVPLPVLRSLALAKSSTLSRTGPTHRKSFAPFRGAIIMKS